MHIYAFKNLARASSKAKIVRDSRIRLCPLIMNAQHTDDKSNITIPDPEISYAINCLLLLRRCTCSLSFSKWTWQNPLYSTQS